jgi:diaminopimelate epimerase
LKFAKTEALGNDFLLMEEVDASSAEEPAELARRICHRRRGVGADGLIVFRADESSSASMKLYNPDGSRAEISGNGLRCLAAYLLYSGRMRQDRLHIDTVVGSRWLETMSRSGPRFVFRSGLGVPRLGSGDVPFDLEPPAEPVIGFPLPVSGRTFPVTVLSMGNPQCVVLVDRLDMDEVRIFGPQIERHPLFPKRTNVEFVEVVNRKRVKIGIWERGAGETAASGTGSAAAAVAAQLSGRIDEKVVVQCPGGDLEIEWRRPGDEVHVTGEAVVVAEGRYLWSSSQAAFELE